MDKSNIKVPSNIYPVNGELRDELIFLHKIEGAPAIRKMLKAKDISLDNRFPDKRIDQTLTAIQKFQLEYEMICIGNKRGNLTKGDRTRGAVLRNGKLEWVCRCIEVECLLFKDCRKNFQETELKHVRENIRLKNEGKFIPIPKQYFEGRGNDFVQEAEKDSLDPITIKQRDEKVDDNNSVVRTEQVLKEKKIESKPTSLPDAEVKDKKDKCENRDYIDQMTIIKADENQKILVNAGPGTGKTYTLIERLKYLVNDLRIEPYDILVLCFSRSAVSEINDRLNKGIVSGEADEFLNVVEIRTFDSFATWFIKNIDKEYNLADKNYDERIELATKYVKENSQAFSNMKHFMVDEIQDLVGVRGELVKSILENTSCGFTLLGDQCQSIYDYQVRDKKREIDSTKFYSWLRDYYKNSILVAEFGRNHRQSRELSELTYRLRQSILHDPEETQKNELKNVIDKIVEISYMQETQNYIEATNSLCFLCESNGEVLKLSEDLRTLNIKHDVQQLSSERYLDKWIGAVFANYHADVMFFEEFARRYSDFAGEFSSNHISDTWERVKSIQFQESDAIIIKDFVKGLQADTVPSDLFVSSRNEKITVSTIHRSKGKEFDTAVLLRSYFDTKFSQGFKNQKFDEEIKKYYVAVTRPRKGLYSTDLRNYRIRKIDDDSGRHYETDFNKYKQTVKRIEFGKPEDIDPLSFVSIQLFSGEREVHENQEYILKNVKPDDQIVLRLNQDNDILQRYFIYHISENGERCIGKTSKQFMYEIFRVRVHNKSKRVLKYDKFSIDNYFENSMEAKYFPQYLDKIYVNNIVTYSSSSISLDMPECFSKKRLWLGVTLVGLARFGQY